METDRYSDVLLELTPNIVVFLNFENQIRKMSKAARDYFAIDGQETFVGANIFDVIKNPILTLFMKKWLEKLNRGIAVDESFPIDRFQNDQYEWFQIQAKNVERDGRIDGKVFFISNVTELYSQKKILDTLMTSLPGDVLIFDRSMRILLASDVLARQNGFHSWRDLSGRTLHELPRFDVSYVEALLDRVILSDEPFHEVRKIARSPNDSRWYYIDVRTIKSTAGVFGYILTQFDITGEIKPKAILEALMDSSSDAIAIVNPEGVIEYASKEMVHAVGFADWRSVIGHPWAYLFRNAHPEASGYAQLFAGDPTQSQQGTIAVDSLGGRAFLNYRIDPLSYQGENFGLIAIASNTTELVAARDRAESAVRAKDAFLANMSHELRTPMNAVLGMNELLSRTPLTSLQKNYTSYIRSSANLLLSIINDILDLSRIDDWKMELSSAPYRFIALVQDVINQVSLKMVEKELSFAVDLDPAIPETLVGDEIRVKQILINLLNNAVKFTERGEVRLSVSSVLAPSRKTVSLVFCVRDTGIGIPKHRQAELFERFSRIESARVGAIEGSGLGLSICKGLVTLMHGSLSVESEEGAGSAFTARIEQGLSLGAAPIVRGGPYSLVRLLAYEPDPVISASILGMCGHLGIRCEMCADIAAFGKALLAEPFAWTHALFEYSRGYEKALEHAPRHPGVKWLALLSMTDFIGKGKDPAIEFIFKPLLITTFAGFLRGDRVDFGGSLPLVSAMGVTPAYFRANGVRVLVVDDSAVNRKVAEGFLQTLDIQVAEAENGAAAIEKAASERFDLILLDHLMPEMDGLEAASRIRSLPGYAAVPIVALTGNTGASYTELFLKAGMNDCLYKPIDFNAFVSCLRKWLPSDKRMDATAVVTASPDDSEPPVAATAPEGTDAAQTAKEPWIPGLDKETGIGFTGSLKNLEMILKVFARTGPKMLEQLESGRRSGNSAQFRTSVHSLISSGANIGAVELSAKARELEQAILGGNTAEADRRYPAVHEALEGIIKGVERHIRDGGNP